MLQLCAEHKQAAYNESLYLKPSFSILGISIMLASVVLVFDWSTVVWPGVGSPAL